MSCYLGLHIWKLPDYRRVEKSANNWIILKIPSRHLPGVLSYLFPMFPICLSAIYWSSLDVSQALFLKEAKMGWVDFCWAVKVYYLGLVWQLLKETLDPDKW